MACSQASLNSVVSYPSMVLNHFSINMLQLPYNFKIILLFKLRRSRVTVAVERLHLAHVAVPTWRQ